jgi:hypothetical protein
MFRKTALALSSMLMAAGLCFAEQPAARTDIKKTPIKRTNAASGKDDVRSILRCLPRYRRKGKGASRLGREGLSLRSDSTCKEK